MLTIIQQYIIMRRFKVDNPIDQLVVNRLRGKAVEGRRVNDDSTPATRGHRSRRACCSPGRRPS